MRLQIDLWALDKELARKHLVMSNLRDKGISSATLSRIRQGKPTTTRTIGKLAHALGVSVESLIEEPLSNVREMA